MKKFLCSALCLFALHAFWCDFGDGEDLIAFLVNLPEGVKDINAYGNNICQFAAVYLETEDINKAYYNRIQKPLDVKKPNHRK